MCKKTPQPQRKRLSKANTTALHVCVCARVGGGHVCPGALPSQAGLSTRTDLPRDTSVRGPVSADGAPADGYNPAVEKQLRHHRSPFPPAWGCFWHRAPGVAGRHVPGWWGCAGVGWRLLRPWHQESFPQDYLATKGLRKKKNAF